MNVSNVNDAPTGGVSVTGTARQGETLSANSTLADADGIPSSGTGALTWHWLADGSPISGATGSTLVLSQAQVGKVISARASYTDQQGTAESATSSATAAVANVNDAPTGGVGFTGESRQGQTLSATHTLADADGIPTAGPGAIAWQWLVDGSPLGGATGSTLLLTAELVGKAVSVRATYTDQQGTAESVAGEAARVVATRDVAPQVEALVPALPGTGGTTVAGDGNGDGVADAQQVNVTSAPLQKQDGSGAAVYATLVADSVAGKSDNVVDASITSFEQKPVPAELPPQIQMPLGLIAFTATLQTVGKTEQFSLYVDTALGVNGYWKQNAAGTWVNLASEPWGGSTTVEGSKTRLDFQITDGGLFDADGLANGTIVDPGAAALMPLSLADYAPTALAPGEFWF